MRSDAVRSKLRQLLQAAWRTRMAKLTLVLLALALLTRTPYWLLLPGFYYGLRLGGVLLQRILYPVRSKLAAFYLNAALLPFLLIVTILIFVGYLVLAHVSAQVIEESLDGFVDWAEQRAHLTQSTYWHARTQGMAPETAARHAFERIYGALEVPGLVAWVEDGTGRRLESRGPVEAYEPLSPAWLGDRDFAGLAARKLTHLELRTRTLIRDGARRLEIGSALLLRTELLNAEPQSIDDSVRGDLGSQERPEIASTLRTTGETTHPGILAAHEPRPSGADTAGATQAALKQRIQSRFPVLLWTYSGRPLAWETGQTQPTGPDIHIAFSIEGATAALLRTSFDAADVIWWGAVGIIGIMVLMQIVSTVRGFVYARSISNSVAKLDQGVREVRNGNFGFRIKPRERDQLGALALAFNDMSERMQLLLDERATHQAMEREMSIAREVQRRLFPEQRPRAPFLEATGVCLPARVVSGDYYDFIRVGEGYDLVVADVSGKGVSAALLMASLQAALRSQYFVGSAGPPELAAVLTQLNRLLHANVEPSRFVTLFMVRYLGDGRIIYCNAGHNPALLVRKQQSEWLRAGGLMLGPFPEHTYREEVIAAQPGDLVCLYTDGVTEALAPSGEQFGEARLSDLVQQNAQLPLEDLQQVILDRVHLWQGEGEASDDVTLVLLRVQEPIGVGGAQFQRRGR